MISSGSSTACVGILGNFLCCVKFRMKMLFNFFFFSFLGEFLMMVTILTERCLNFVWNNFYCYNEFIIADIFTEYYCTSRYHIINQNFFGFILVCEFKLLRTCIILVYNMDLCNRESSRKQFGVFMFYNL